MKSQIRTILLRTVVPSLVLSAGVILSICQVGCRSTEEGIGILEGDFSVPQIESFSVTASNCLKIDFSKTVTSANATVYSRENEMKYCNALVEYSLTQKTASYILEKQTDVGMEYILEGQISDVNGNSLTFSIPFTGFNDNPAKIILSEVRNAYGTASVKDSMGVSQKVHRSEYVEVYVLKSGNLCGFEICSAADGDDRKFVFPSINVNAGEYITVHMRKVDAEGFDAEGMVSELGSDFSLSTHEDSCSVSRDLWSDNTKAVFADSDIVYIKNIYDGSVVDALVYAKSSVEMWKESFNEITARIDASEIWNGGAFPENGVSSDNITSTAATRSFSRQNITQAIEACSAGKKIENGKEFWMITANSGVGKNMVQGITPGQKNSSNEYKK